MSESLIERFSKLEYRGLIPAVLFEEISHQCEKAALFLVKNAALQGWSAQNIPLLTREKLIRQLIIRLEEEQELSASLIAGRIAQFKVPERWTRYKLKEDNPHDLVCLAIPFKYGRRLFGALLCFKNEGFSKGDIEKIKEAALCAAEFSVILPPQLPSDRPPAMEPPIPAGQSNEERASDGIPVDQQLSPIENTEGDEKIMRAQLLARLLVNNIKLYNEEQVIVGRIKKDLRSRLKKEIEGARKFYDSRVSEEIKEKHDYFENELIVNLAGGNIAALG